MADRTVYYVSAEGDRWKVEERGGGRPRLFDSKDGAVQEACDLADKHQPSQIVIRAWDGHIEEKRTFGDSFPSEG